MFAANPIIFATDNLLFIFLFIPAAHFKNAILLQPIVMHLADAFIKVLRMGLEKNSAVHCKPACLRNTLSD